MSQSRREIVFSARDNGVNNVMNQLRQSANQLGRELINEATQNSRSAREAVTYYEQQVRLMEKRNKLTNDASRLSSQQRFEALGGKDAPPNVRQQYSQNLQDLGREKREDQIQIDLLRELIQTIKSTSNNEVREERIDTINTLTQEADNNQDLITLSDRLNEESGKGGGDDEEGAKKGRRGRNVNGVLNAAESAAGAHDPVQAGTGVAASLANSNPVMLAIAAIVGIATLGLQRRADRELAAGQVSGLTGIDTESIIRSQIGTSDFGQYGPIDLNVSREQFLSKYLPSTIRSSGSSAGGVGRAMQGIELEKALSLSDGTSGSLERLTRVMEDNIGAQRLTNKIYSASYGTGALGDNNQDMARMQDIIQGFTTFRESQFMSSGSTNNTQTLGLMGMLQKMGGNFNRDDYAFDTINRLNTGLQGGTSEAQAIKFGLLRQMNPNMDYFDLQTEMSKGVDSPGYLSSVVKMVKSRGGTESQQKIWLNSLLGDSMRGVDIKALINGDINADDIDRPGTGKSIDFKSRAVGASSRAKTQLDFGAEAMNDMMQKMGEFISDTLDHLKDISGTLKKINSNF